jgi:dolichol-phosphate mannosyltransferase
MRWFVPILSLLQLAAALRVIARLIATSGGTRVARSQAASPPTETVTIIVPVLNEAVRLSSCLKGLASQGSEVSEILVIDGGSTDGTRELVHQWQQHDNRISMIDASPVPAGINGKAHGLQRGWEGRDRATKWILTIDADVRLDSDFTRSFLEHATVENVPTLSAATMQRLSGSGEALLHPAMLTTLVYRFGIPGSATTRVDAVQANGQCFLTRRDVLERAGGFSTVLDSVCEDVTLARHIASMGFPVGFYETGDLAAVEMYSGWRDAWENWTRSLPMRDRFARWSSFAGLAEVLLAQALPLWLALVYRRLLGSRHWATGLNLALLSMRLGVLAGTARAYERRPWTYWCSPLVDLAVALRICQMAVKRTHVWRGRAFTPGGMT